MKSLHTLFAISLSLACLPSVVPAPAYARQSRATAPSQPKPDGQHGPDASQAYEEVQLGIQGGMAMLYEDNTFGLSLEDRFLLGFFQAVVIEKYFSPAMMGRQLNASMLPVVKKEALRIFALQLKKLPRKLSWVEQMGWFPALCFGLCLFTGIFSYVGLVWQSPSPRTFFVCSFLALLTCIGQAVAMVYRLGQRLGEASQAWQEAFVQQAQSAMAQNPGRMPMR